MTEQETRETLAELTPDQLLDAAVQLSLDCGRLRSELDNAEGVVR